MVSSTKRRDNRTSSVLEDDAVATTLVRTRSSRKLASAKKRTEILPTAGVRNGSVSGKLKESKHTTVSKTKKKEVQFLQ